MGPWTRWMASAMGYSTTREPQNTQARWLTEPAALRVPQRIAAVAPSALVSSTDPCRSSSRSLIP